MNKIDFMGQLECLLQNISEQERQEALQYYGDYFDDAGPENEQAVIEALGNPARVAENIKRDLYGAGYGDGCKNRKPVTGRELTEYGTDIEEPAENEGQNGTEQGNVAQSATAQGIAEQSIAAPSMEAQGTADHSTAVQGIEAQRTAAQGMEVQGTAAPSTAAQSMAAQGTAAPSTAAQGTAVQSTAEQGMAAQNPTPQGTAAYNTAEQSAMSQRTAAESMAARGAAAQSTAAQGTAAYGASSHGIPGTGAAAAAAAAPWQGVAQPAVPWDYGKQDSRSKSGKNRKEPLSGGIIALIIILCIFCLPVAVGLLGGLVGLLAGVAGVILGLLAAWFCMILGFGVAALVCIIAGLFVAVGGVVGLGLHPMAGLGLIGGGLMAVGIGIFFLILTVAMAGVVTPAIFRGIGRLLSRKKKKA